MLLPRTSCPGNGGLTETPGIGLLLVEDNPTDVFFIKKAFSTLLPTLPIQVALDGDAAVKLLSQNPPTHLILDIKLPYRSGLQVLEWIRSQDAFDRLRVVILTSSNELPDTRRSLELGVDSYRIKPVSFPELVALLRDILAQWGLAG